MNSDQQRAIDFARRLGGDRTKADTVQAALEEKAKIAKRDDAKSVAKGKASDGAKVAKQAESLLTRLPQTGTGRSAKYAKDDALPKHGPTPTGTTSGPQRGGKAPFGS